MRESLRTLGLVLAAVLAFSAVAAGASSAAEAPRWRVSEAYLGAGTSKAFTATSTSDVTIAAAGLGITFKSPSGECSQSGEIEGSAAGAPGKKKNLALTCKKVIVVGGEKLCSANSVGAAAGTIVTNTLKSTLVWLKSSGKAAGDLLEPASGTTWTEIEITGAECAVSGKYKLSNQAIAEILPVEEEVVTSTVNNPTAEITSYYDNEATRAKQTPTHLKLGASNAKITGQFSFALTSKEPAGVSPPSSEQSEGKGPVEPRWKVGGKFLGAGNTRSFTASSSSPMSLRISSWGVVINMAECTLSGKIVGSAAKQPGTKKQAVLTCKGVAVEEPGSKCTVNSAGQPAGTIVTEALKSTLVRLQDSVTGSTLGEVLKPESGATYFTWEIKGAECPIATTAPITGGLMDQILPAESEVTTGESVFPTTAFTKYWDGGLSPKCEEKYLDKVTGLCERPETSLRQGVLAISLVGSLKFSLTSGEKWGVFLG